MTSLLLGAGKGDTCPTHLTASLPSGALSLTQQESAGQKVKYRRGGACVQQPRRWANAEPQFQEMPWPPGGTDHLLLPQEVRVARGPVLSEWQNLTATPGAACSAGAALGCTAPLRDPRASAGTQGGRGREQCRTAAWPSVGMARGPSTPGVWLVSKGTMP